MKFFFALIVLAVAGCSASTNPYLSASNGASLDTLPPFSPGGIDYVSPGTFIGTWQIFDIQTEKADTNHCTMIITEADSIVSGTITNDYTHEVLQVRGRHGATMPGVWNPHQYHAQMTSNIGVPDSMTQFVFSLSGDTVACLGSRFPPKDYWDQGLWIQCFRQSTTKK